MNFTTKPGQRVLSGEDNGVGVVLVYDGVPDWVHLPKELGGAQATVKHSVRQPCPCGQHETLVLVLDAQHQGKGLLVAECPTHGYLWFVEGSTATPRA